MEEDLSIGVCSKNETLGFAFEAKLTEVVDLAIEADDVAFVATEHGLVTGGREVEDGEASVS
jgi:hypothetical protein